MVRQPRSVLRRLRDVLARTVLGRPPAPPPAPPAGPSARPTNRLADWQRYARSLEREFEAATRGGDETALVRHEIALSPALRESESARQPLIGVTLDPGPEDGPRVTVIVPAFGHADLTRACIRALAAHPPRRARADYVLVDDASPAELTPAFGAVGGLTVLRNGTNAGFVRSCNRAARLSDAPYLVLLNNDTIVREGWLDALVETAERDPSVGVAGAKLLFPDGTLQEAGAIVWRDATGWNYGRGARADDPAYAYVRDADYCSGAALLVRRALFERLGGFDERFSPAYFEDTDLCFAARREGFRVVYQPRAEVVHREGGTSGTDVAAGVKRHQALNQPKFRQKWRAVLDAEHAASDPRNVERAARRLQGAGTIAMIDNYVPEPDRDSGSNKNARIIRLLRELGWHVIFIPDNDRRSEPYTGNLQQIGVEVVYATPNGAPAAERVRAALGLADVVWIARPDVFAHFRERLDEFPELPVVYDTMDLHHLRRARELELLGDRSETEWRKQRELKAEELEIGRRADVVLAITELERRVLESEGLDNVHVVPNVHVPAGTGRPFEEREGLVFIGGYAHPPNADAVEWLVREIMPRVWESEPEMRLTLLGSNPTDAVRALAGDPRVTVTGFVADVAPYFDAARVFVSPLRYGAGLKGKIGQSLEHALPVVTTSVGAEGFAFEHERDALIADGAEAFAAAVLRVYRDRALWQRCSQGGAARLAPFTPERVKQQIAAALADAQVRHAARRRPAAV